MYNAQVIHHIIDNNALKYSGNQVVDNISNTQNKLKSPNSKNLKIEINEMIIERRLHL